MIVSISKDELDALKKNAARYEWLRGRVWANDPHIFTLPVLSNINGTNMKGSVAQHFDDAIDRNVRATRCKTSPQR